MLTEPRISVAHSSDEHLHNGGVKDTAANFEAQTNQTIVDKYRLLKMLKQRMTNIKRNFNERALALQQDKQEKCALLAIKIEKFCKNHKKLYPNNEHMIDVIEFMEKTKYFDEKAFKVRWKKQTLDVFMDELISYIPFVFFLIFLLIFLIIFFLIFFVIFLGNKNKG